MRAFKLGVTAYESRTQQPALAIVAGRFRIRLRAASRYYSPEQLREEFADVMRHG